MEFDEIDLEEPEPESAEDKYVVDATTRLSKLFDEDKEKVYYSRQLEVRYEADYYHWVTNRAIGNLAQDGFIRKERHDLRSGGTIDVLRHSRNRYYRRAAARLVGLVEEYSAPNVGGALGLHGESMVLEAFARNSFVMRARNASEFEGRKWTTSKRNLDFIWERDGIRYGMEVKNTLGYIEYEELEEKVQVCRSLGLRPVLVCRMLPKSWIWEVINEGGFALILKWQLYYWTHGDLARRVRRELGLPVDAPKKLHDRTMHRFLRWHRKCAKSESNSHGAERQP